MSDDEVPVKRYLVYLCDLCVAGAGGECHVPGCALWLNRAPDMQLTPQPYGMFVLVNDDGSQREAEPKETP